MNRFKFKKIVNLLTISSMISSVFVSNIVGMEKNKPKTKKQVIKMVNTVEEMTRKASRMISENEDVSSIDIELLKIAEFLVFLSKLKKDERTGKLFESTPQHKLLTMIRYVTSIRISFRYSSFNEYKSLFEYMETHKDVFGGCI